jgi:predicted nucleic acid-binding protein
VRRFFDTSVLVAALAQAHPRHATARPWLQRARSKEFVFLVGTHSLAETFSGLTRLPISPRISPAQAEWLIRTNILDAAETVPLTAADYVAVLKRMADLNILGGAVYDALLTRAAENAGADEVLTFNAAHFIRVWPEGANRIVVP